MLAHGPAAGKVAIAWFDVTGDSLYMIMVAGVAPAPRPELSTGEQRLFRMATLDIPRSDIPTVTHVDHSARIQTVHADTNPRYRALLKAFRARTDCPVLVNTRFNVRGEPIACTPEYAFHRFTGTELDALVVGSCVLEKARQDQALISNYKDVFDLD